LNGDDVQSALMSDGWRGDLFERGINTAIGSLEEMADAK